MEHIHTMKQKSGNIFNLTVDSGVTHTHASQALEKCWFGQGFGEAVSQVFIRGNKLESCTFSLYPLPEPAINCFYMHRLLSEPAFF